MSKQPSVETQLRTAKRQLSETRSYLAEATAERNSYRVRAERAEREAAEWKARFDKLLERTPKEQP